MTFLSLLVHWLYDYTKCYFIQTKTAGKQNSFTTLYWARASITIIHKGKSDSLFVNQLSMDDGSQVSLGTVKTFN